MSLGSNIYLAWSWKSGDKLSVLPCTCLKENVMKNKAQFYKNIAILQKKKKKRKEKVTTSQATLTDTEQLKGKMV